MSKCEWFEGNHDCGKPAAWRWNGSYLGNRGTNRFRTWKKYYCDNHYRALGDPGRSEWERLTPTPTSLSGVK